MNPSQQNNGWAPPGQPSSMNVSRAGDQPAGFSSSAPPHQQPPSNGPVLPPPSGPFYQNHPQNGPNLPSISGMAQSSPGMASHRPPLPTHEQNAPAQPHGQQHQPSNYSLPTISQSVGGQPMPSQPAYGREREAQTEVREREYDQGRRDQQRERDQQDQQARERQQQQHTPHQTHAEPVQLHQPVAVGPHMRSAIHNGVLSNGGPPPNAAAASGPPNGQQSLFPSAQYDRAPPAGMQPAPPNVQTVLPFPAGTPGAAQMAAQGAIAPGQQPILNDALSYLDQVKVQFAGEPNVYNQFLDIMKDFKSQAIDTPGVIRRVSTLFTGHPNLIQGFNTFLPPGYRIECGTADDPNAIRVTTPMGTQVSPMVGALRPLSNPRQGDAMANGPRGAEGHAYDHEGAGWHRGNEQAESLYGPRPGGPYGPPDGAVMGDSNDAHASQYQNRDQAMGVNEALLVHQQEARGVSQLQNAVSAAQGVPAMQETVMQPGMSDTDAQPAYVDKRPPVEFNHAISYVNKIKNRFSAQPEIYKQFLEILQTYQRESKPIQHVYQQVTNLFNGAPDLLEDFKQFLPESAAHAKAQAARQAAEDATAVSSMRGDGPSQHTPRAEQGRMPPMGQFATPSATRDGKRKRGDRSGFVTTSMAPDFGAGKNGLARDKRGKHATHQTQQPAKYQPQPDAPPVSPTLIPPLPEPMAPTTATTANSEELAFFDRVKKFIANKNSMNEFLKLCNLYSQDLIDKNLLVYRAQNFIGSNQELFAWFKNFLGYDGRDQIIENRARPVSGRVNLNNCRSLGQSYRLLPQRERIKPCSGRDELCNSVLNDDWVSHPTWASEDSGFIVQKKNVHEEGLHRIEEERHDYDLYIQNLERFIQCLEPIASQNLMLSSAERRQWSLQPDFAGQTLPIYKKVLAKIYGRENASVILDDLVARPSSVVPVILQRCRMICEKWKATQREWEKVWREQTQRMFWKSLDHQGSSARQGDKRQFQTKTLQNEIQVKYEEQRRQLYSGETFDREAPKFQQEYTFQDESVLLDASRLVLVYAEQNHSVDLPRLLPFIKEFIPLFFGFDLARFQERIESEFSGTTSDNEEELEEETAASEESSAPRGRRMNGRTDLRRNVLDRGRSGRPSRGEKDDSTSVSRASTPEVAAGASKDDSANSDELMTEDSRTKTWVNHLSDMTHSTWRRRYDVKPDQPFKRDVYSLYANLPIFCFFKMFTILYERLYYLKNDETQVRDAVARSQASKPANDLRMIDKHADFFFANTSSNAEYYPQMLVYFEDLIKGNVEMSFVEDILRRFYLNKGWMLYSFERMLSSLVRFAIAILQNDPKDRSWDILQLFFKDRRKEVTTHRDEMAMRRQVEKWVKEGDVYRIAYNQNRTPPTAGVRIIKKTDPTFTANDEEGHLDWEQRWAYYVSSYTSLEPTEGVWAPYVKRAYLQRNDRAAASEAEAMAPATASGGNNAPDSADDSGVERAARSMPGGPRLDLLLSNESLWLKISPSNYRIYWAQPGSGHEQEWWVASAPPPSRPSRSTSKRPTRQTEADDAGAEDAAEAETPARADDGDNDDDAMDEGAEGEDREHAGHAFDAKFVMNNRWMKGLSRDEVDAKNATFREWIGGAVKDKEDVAMEG